MTNLNISSPSTANANSNESKEPPQKKQCVDESSNSPSGLVSNELQGYSEFSDVKPNITSMKPSFSSKPPQHIPKKDVKPAIEDTKPHILGMTSPPNMG